MTRCYSHQDVYHWSSTLLCVTISFATVPAFSFWLRPSVLFSREWWMWFWHLSAFTQLVCFCLSANSHANPIRSAFFLEHLLSSESCAFITLPNLVLLMHISILVQAYTNSSWYHNCTPLLVVLAGQSPYDPWWFLPCTLEWLAPFFSVFVPTVLDKDSPNLTAWWVPASSSVTCALLLLATFHTLGVIWCTFKT